MKYKYFLLILFFMPFINTYSQNIENTEHTIKGRYEGKIFTLIDSVGDFYIQKREASTYMLDGTKYTSNGFTIEVLKTLKFSKSILNISQMKYIFSNHDGETLVIQEFMDDTREKITTIEVMPPCIELPESNNKRYACFYIKGRYLVYFYNVKAENNYKMFNSIQSIKSR